MKDPAGNPAPSGGFKQGGWYSGYQYFNGSFAPQAGQIHPESNQPGAGQQVSTQVAGTKNVAYTTSQNQKGTIPQASPQAPSAAQMISGFQQGASSILDTVSQDANKSDEQILAETKQALTGNLPPQPTAPNLVSTYQGFLASTGVNDLNTQAASLKSQIAAVQSTLEAQKANEEGQPANVTLGVISGRETEETRQAQVKLDSLNLQLGVVTDQINTQMSNINTLMQLTEQDYQNASTAWQNEFNINAKVYDAFTTNVQNRNSLALEVQKAAATNLQTFVNLLTSGNIQYNQLSPDQQLQITQMETQAGLPAGTISQIQMSPKDRLLYTSSYRGQVTAIVQGTDGQLTTQTFGTPAPLSGTSGQKAIESELQPQFAAALQKVASSGNNQGHVDPANWNAALDDWVSQGGSSKTFIDTFKQYTDPNRKDFETAYGISLQQRGITPSAEQTSNYYNSP